MPKHCTARKIRNKWKTIECYTDGLVITIKIQEIVERLSAAKTSKKDGKGNWYVDVVNAHMPLLEAMQTA